MYIILGQTMKRQVKNTQNMIKCGECTTTIALMAVVISPLSNILQPFSHSGYLDPYSYWCS